MTDKEHKHVLDSIDGLVLGLNAGGRNLGYLYFQEVSSYDPKANRETRSFDMTRDGMVLLIMGYTGEREWTPSGAQASHRCGTEEPTRHLGVVVRFSPQEVDRCPAFISSFVHSTAFI